MTSDDRFTSGLILDVLDVLERHGYHRYDSRHTGYAVGAILDLAYVYHGTRDVSYGYYAPPAPHAAPGPSGPGAKRRGHPHRRRSQHRRRRTRHRRRLQTRPRRRLRRLPGPDLRDLPVPAPRRRGLRPDGHPDAAHRQGRRTANSAQPEPGSLPPPRQPHPAADREAGQ